MNQDYKREDLPAVLGLLALAAVIVVGIFVKDDDATAAWAAVTGIVGIVGGYIGGRAYAAKVSSVVTPPAVVEPAPASPGGGFVPAIPSALDYGAVLPERADTSYRLPTDPKDVL